MYWNDLVDPQGKSLGPAVWTCNCLSPRTGNREQIFSKMHLTKITQDEICENCGHYALRVEERIMKLGRSTLHHVGRQKRKQKK